MGSVVPRGSGTGAGRDGNTADSADARNGTATGTATGTVTGTVDGEPAEAAAAEPVSVSGHADDGALHVSIEQDLCTGDGLCVQYAPEVFEFDIDGLAYVKDASGELLTDPGARTGVPPHLRLEVLDAARECPGECIHVRRAADGVAVAGPEADD